MTPKELYETDYMPNDCTFNEVKTHKWYDAEDMVEFGNKLLKENNVVNGTNTGGEALHKQNVSGNAPLEAEAYVKEYFKLPENWNEKDKLPNGTDIGIIVDLLVGFADKHYR